MRSYRRIYCSWRSVVLRVLLVLSSQYASFRIACFSASAWRDAYAWLPVGLPAIWPGPCGSPAPSPSGTRYRGWDVPSVCAGCPLPPVAVLCLACVVNFFILLAISWGRCGWSWPWLSCQPHCWGSIVGCVTDDWWICNLILTFFIRRLSYVLLFVQGAQ